MDNETRDFLDDRFKTFYERQDALKDSLNEVRLALTSKITRHEEQISQHDRDIDAIHSRGWHFVAAALTGVASLAWHGINSLLGKH